MKRLNDWPERLNNYFDSVAKKPFQWGENDCCTFARGAVQAITGHVIKADAFDSYRCRSTAALLLKDIGLKERVTAALGEPIEPTFAQRGDIVMYEHEAHGPALGVCAGAVFYAPGDNFLQWRRMFEAECAWRVG